MNRIQKEQRMPYSFHSKRQIGKLKHFEEFNAKVVSDLTNEFDWLDWARTIIFEAADQGHHYTVVNPELMGDNWAKLYEYLVNGGFEVDYDPEVNLYEAKIRW